MCAAYASMHLILDNSLPQIVLRPYIDVRTRPLVSEGELSQSSAGVAGVEHEGRSRDSSSPGTVPMPELAIQPPTPREVIASVVMQYLSEARSEPLEEVDFSTPFMDAGLDSLDMLKVS